MTKKLEFTCIYLVVKNIEESADFYTSLFETKIDDRFENRWIQIKTSNGPTLGLLSADYDKQKIETGEDLSDHYNQEFINNFTSEYRSGDTVVLNLKADNLEKEHERVGNLNVSDISKIQYVNFMMPYHFFMVKDPDGNMIEISDV